MTAPGSPRHGSSKAQSFDRSDMASDWIGSPFAEDGGGAVTEAIVVSGAAAAFVCSLTASLLGLTTRARVTARSPAT